jgi:hypothetical protein
MTNNDIPDGSERASISDAVHGLMREFVGFLSADVPELHGVEVPRLAESLDRFLKLRDEASGVTK